MTNNGTGGTRVSSVNSDCLVSGVINNTHFQVICPLTRVLGCVVETSGSGVICLIIVVIINSRITSQRCRGSSSTGIGVAQCRTSNSGDLKYTTIRQVCGCSHPVLILSISRKWLTKSIDKLLFCLNIYSFINGANCKRSSNCSNVVKNVFSSSYR